jgi:hypothetical protein
MFENAAPILMLKNSLFNLQLVIEPHLPNIQQNLFNPRQTVPFDTLPPYFFLPPRVIDPYIFDLPQHQSFIDPSFFYLLERVTPTRHFFLPRPVIDPYLFDIPQHLSFIDPNFFYLLERVTVTTHTPFFWQAFLVWI